MIFCTKSPQESDLRVNFANWFIFAEVIIKRQVHWFLRHAV